MPRAKPRAILSLVPRPPPPLPSLGIFVVGEGVWIVEAGCDSVGAVVVEVEASEVLPTEGEGKLVSEDIDEALLVEVGYSVERLLGGGAEKVSSVYREQLEEPSALLLQQCQSSS